MQVQVRVVAAPRAGGCRRNAESGQKENSCPWQPPSPACAEARFHPAFYPASRKRISGARIIMLRCFAGPVVRLQ